MEQETKARVDALVRSYTSSLPEALQAALSDAISQLVDSEAAGVRERAIALCIRRGELWRTTSLRRDRLAEEARARSNEAFYLADILETGEDLPATDPSTNPAANGGIQARSARD